VTVVVAVMVMLAAAATHGAWRARDRRMALEAERERCARLRQRLADAEVDLDVERERCGDMRISLARAQAELGKTGRELVTACVDAERLRIAQRDAAVRLGEDMGDALRVGLSRALVRCGDVYSVEWIADGGGRPWRARLEHAHGDVERRGATPTEATRAIADWTQARDDHEVKRLRALAETYALHDSTRERIERERDEIHVTVEEDEP
jgi:hypothetical protein